MVIAAVAATLLISREGQEVIKVACARIDLAGVDDSALAGGISAAARSKRTCIPGYLDDYRGSDCGDLRSWDIQPFAIRRPSPKACGPLTIGCSAPVRETTGVRNGITGR